MKDYTIRAGRTFLQAFIGTLLSMGLFSQVADTGVLPGWNVFAQVGLVAASSGVVAVLSYTQNRLEDADRLRVMPK